MSSHYLNSARLQLLKMLWFFRGCSGLSDREQSPFCSSLFPTISGSNLQTVNSRRIHSTGTSLAALTALASQPQFSLFKGIFNPLPVRCHIPMQHSGLQQGSLQEMRLLENQSGQPCQSLYFLHFQKSKVHQLHTENKDSLYLQKNRLSLLINLEEMTVKFSYREIIELAKNLIKTENFVSVSI